jgi:hypothetical protein
VSARGAHNTHNSCDCAAVYRQSMCNEDITPPGRSSDDDTYVEHFNQYPILCSDLLHVATPPCIRIPSPGPTATPDQRMLYMTVDELLTTETRYVNALQYVLKVCTRITVGTIGLFACLQYYVSEMQRTDLPYELRGHKYTIFGNIERIYEFHACHFLPDLRNRLTRQCDSVGRDTLTLLSSQIT